MLFLGKKNVFKMFSCLKIRFTENQFRYLVRSNIFTENALHSQATQFSIHFLNCKHVDNESISLIHKRNKTQQKKKIKSGQIEIARWRRRWDRSGGKIKWRRDWSGEIERCGATIDERRSAAIDDWRGVIVGLELGLWSPAKSLLPLSLRSGFSLSLSLARSLFWFAEAIGSLGLSLF